MENKKGFTLVEVIVAVFISTILIAAVYFMFVRVYLENESQNEFVKMQDTLRSISQIVETDIRKSSQYIDIDVAGDIYTIIEKDHENGSTLKETPYELVDNVLYRNAVFLMDKVESFKIIEKEYYLEVEIKSESKGREIKHDKKIYLRQP
ncbi:MAG: prepilin-type N-terminal cleavage/methylation domain-containing protein [Erysipelothrix sp.]|nr:prepilin-type N-terminal cleavage/methylation domain-containing protein [Erysipelothrix sp.]